MPFNYSYHTGLVSSRVSVTSWGGASLALVDHPSRDDATTEIPYGVDISLHQPVLRIPYFPTGLVKTESDFIVRSA